MQQNNIFGLKKELIAWLSISLKILPFLTVALAACSSSQYHDLVLVVPELLSEFEFFGFLRVPYVNMRLLRVNSGYIGKLKVTMGKLRVY